MSGCRMFVSLKMLGVKVYNATNTEKKSTSNHSSCLCDEGLCLLGNQIIKAKTNNPAIMYMSVVMLLDRFL